MRYGWRKEWLYYSFDNETGTHMTLIEISVWIFVQI